MIELKNVSKKFRIRAKAQPTLKAAAVSWLARKKQKEDFWALKDISFQVGGGQTLGIIGPNGAGKSTLLGLIAGTMRPTEGSIQTKGRISSLLELGAGFHPDLSGRENIYLNGSIVGLKKSELDKKFDRIVEFAGLTEFIDTPVKYYSSGMYVRLGFSIAVEVDPDILLVDEVLAVGDEMFKKKCLERIAEFQTRGKSMLVVSHDLDTIKRISDSILLLDEGRLLEIGQPARVVDKYRRLGLQREGGILVKEWGTKEAELEEVKFYNSRGAETHHFVLGEPVIIEINYFSKKRIANPVFGFSITDSKGNLCLGSNTTIENYFIDFIEGKGSVKLTIDPFIIRGKFFFSFSIHSQDHKTNYHRQDNWYTIWADAPVGTDEKEGFVDLSCRWEKG